MVNTKQKNELAGLLKRLGDTDANETVVINEMLNKISAFEATHEQTTKALLDSQKYIKKLENKLDGYSQYHQTKLQNLSDETVGKIGGLKEYVERINGELSTKVPLSDKFIKRRFTNNGFPMSKVFPDINFIADTGITIQARDNIEHQRADVFIASTVTSLTPGGSTFDVQYRNSSGSFSGIASNTTSTQKFLAQTGTGSAAQLPVWTTISTLTSPLTTKGDLWGFSNVNARIPIGANNSVLTADSTQALGLKWSPFTSSQWVGTTATNIYYGSSAITRLALFDAVTGAVTLGDVDGAFGSGILTMSSSAFSVESLTDGSQLIVNGSVTIQSGDTDTLLLISSQGGPINIFGGAGDAPSFYAGSSISILSGLGGDTDGLNPATQGGNVSIVASDGGNGDLSNASGNGGTITINPGQPGANNGGGSGLQGYVLINTVGNALTAIGTSFAPTAILMLGTGTAAAHTAPLKFLAGTKMTTAEAGAMEYTNRLYFTNSVARFTIGGTLFDHFADVGNTTTTETDLYSDTLLAGMLANNGDKITATYGGIFVSSASATRELRAYFGGTLIFDSGALSISAGSDAWQIDVTIIRESSSVVRCSVVATTAGASLNVYDNYTRVTGLTLANTQILKITGQAAGVGAATNDIVAKLGTVIYQPAV